MAVTKDADNTHLERTFEHELPRNCSALVRIQYPKAEYNA